MDVVPRFNCSNDGSLLIPADKSSRIRAIQKVAGPVNTEINEQPTISPIRGAEKYSFLMSWGY